MPHLVNRRGYWSLEESYREGGRVRKRYIRYLGRFKIDWRATLASEVQGVDWDAIEKQECERAEAAEKARVEKLAALPVGLHVGPTDPVEVIETTSEIAQEPQAVEAPSANASDKSDDLGSDDASV
jgi:hypothetical protein